ncbi:MAG: metalloregulator ArsR/SmtB family transcription factor [Rhodovibrionaceae bacterium]|nr:metalloregulator ArsR/SmtB family transcription factor [Rhodovibrionaceae bacterium]
MLDNQGAQRTGDVFHAIADANRRRILDLLATQERSVQELVPHLDVTFGAVSQHLKVLFDSGLVSRRKDGRKRYYRVEAEGLREVHEWTERYRANWEERLDALGRHLDQDR